jgi:hypothetical protein
MLLNWQIADEQSVKRCQAAEVWLLLWQKEIEAAFLKFDGAPQEVR